MTNIASNVAKYKAGFEANGIETLAAVNYRDSNVVDGSIDYIVDEAIPELEHKMDPEFATIIKEQHKKERKNAIWEKALKECDTFMFIGSSFRGDNHDYIQLKHMGKKIITRFSGCDIRWKPAMEQEFVKYGMKPLQYLDAYISKDILVPHLHYVRFAERYSDRIISLPNISQLALRPYFTLYYCIDLERIKENPSQRKTNPLVLHAPTNREVKGTKYVADAFQRLKNEGMVFQPMMVEQMKHSEILELYRNADILVGQLLLPNGGNQEREALAAGMVVLSNISPLYPQRIPPECPIIDVNPDTVYERLKEIILDYPKRQRIAQLGRPYVEKYHDLKKLCRDILTFCEDDSLAEEHKPTFFREDFVPETPEVTWLYNKYTDFVKECDWYKQNIAPGERAGLRF